MAFMGCYTKAQQDLIDARAKEIMKTLRIRSACDCGAAEEGHAPDCGGELALEAAWDHAVDRAAEELGF